MKKIFFVVIILFNVCVFSQDTTKTMKRSDLKLNDFSYKNNWNYFILTDTIEATILEYLPAGVSCGVIASASLTIVKTDYGDTLRIITLCNTSEEFKIGQIVMVIPISKPNFNVVTPISLNLNPTSNEFEPSMFDLTVFKTTWGYF